MSELTARLEAQMRALQLRAMLNCYRELSDKAAMSNLGYEEYLSLLLEEELRGKVECEVAAKIQKARFPYVKTLEAFDFSFQPGLKDMEILALSSLEFIENKGNLIFLGPPGVGKTHLAVALGIKARPRPNTECCL